ncbi:hypothetical protein ACFUIW_38780 [Streptomyces sp. NPDC057245]|uniref:hypothetical protein n=1 Tax=Streptomyces TaxID=1883 RepID=UPI001C1E26A8|nr:hypothetical protein [Streptomyces sp. A108]MBU6534686.1 hypothetical protein [Streptomyces sp. A108]
MVKLAPGEAATPQQIVPEGVDPTAVRAAAEDLKLTTCLYAPIVTPTPEPPFDDREKFGVSKQGPGLRGWSLAHDSQGGTDSEPRTTSTRIDYDVPIVIPDDWAQPSQITGYANPKVKGAIRAASRRFTAGTSTANGQQYLNIGMERDGDEYWQSMYDMKFSRENGLDETKGFESGPRDDPFFANIDTTPGHLYKFRVKSQSHVTSNPEFLAPAAAQLDFGAGIDAPAHLIEDGYIEPDGGWKTFIVQYKSPFDVEC